MLSGYYSGISGSAQTDIVAHDVEGVANVENGGDVRKEAFIMNLVANMTIPELGETRFL